MNYTLNIENIFIGNSLVFRKFRSTFANQSGPFKRTNKVTEFFVVLSEVSDEVCDWDSEWGSERISGS